MNQQSTAQLPAQAPRSLDQLELENRELQLRLHEAEETIRAIQTGAVDAFMVDGELGQQVYTLEGADRPYRLVIEQMQQGAATLLNDGTIAYCNTAFAVLLKVPHQKLVGASFWDFVVPEDAMRHRDLVASQPSPVQGEVRLLRSDGEMLYTYVTFNSLSRASGASLGVLVTDLTFQRYHEQLSSAHQALRESEARFREIIDALPTAIYSTDAQGRLTHFNPACVEFSGRMPALGTDKWCVTWKLFHADGRPMAHDACPMAIALKEGRSLRGIEAIAERPDGSRIWFTPYPTLLRNTAGEIVGGINMLVDITERKIAEDALNQSKIALTDADRRKDEFLATLAHELRNPLAPIRNGLHIMRTELAGARIDELRDMMDRQVTHLVRLIDDLLDVSRVSQGKIDLRKQRITLQSAIEAATEASRPLIEESGHRLALTLPDTPLWLDADLTRIAQVLGNLLNNAAKYTPEGGLITVSARSEGNEAVLTVSDNGIGIPADMLPRVFDLFTQVDRNLERSQGGLGIGLALVRQLVVMHGGTIEAHSAGVDRGSMFTVRLPLAVVDTAVESHTSPNSATAPTPPQRVLVVDDNVPAAETTGWMLEVDGHTVEYAYDAHAALAAAPAFKPDVILLDIGLPGMNGYDLCRLLRQNAQFRDTLIIAQTGWGQERDRQLAKDAGFDHYLVKPVKYDDLEALFAQTFAPGAA